MRTIIDLPRDAVEALDRIGRAESRSRAALIREAVAQFLAGRLPSPNEDAAFGAWSDRNVDGLAYERHLREQWDD